MVTGALSGLRLYGVQAISTIFYYGTRRIGVLLQPTSLVDKDLKSKAWASFLLPHRRDAIKPGRPVVKSFVLERMHKIFICGYGAVLVDAPMRPPRLVSSPSSAGCREGRNKYSPAGNTIHKHF